jgi:dCTP deaminase
MFLASDLIRSRCVTDGLIKSYAPENVKQASYDLRLGPASYVVGDGAPIHLTENQRYVTIAPGQFALLTTLEELAIPSDLLAFITLRNTFKMQGLINVSGFHVDPSYEGKLVFGVNNIGPSDICLRLGEPTFTIFFCRVDGTINGARPPFRDELPLQYVQLLGGSSITLSKLQAELEDLRKKMLLYAPLGIALLIALILNLMKK